MDVTPFSRLAVLGMLLASAVWADDMAIDLSAPDAAASWVFSDTNAKIEHGELVLDGRIAMTRAFFVPASWSDVRLQAKFLVDSQDHGVLACGFVVRAADAEQYYYVHFDQGQAILCRADAKQSWNELKRVSGLDKPAGRWHTGELQCAGNTLRVLLNGTLLYEIQDEALKEGRIGFYANQGRAHVKDIVVSGNAQPATGAFTLPAPPPQDFTYVCTDAGAGAYEAFPDVCRLSDGRLMCVFYAGYGHVALPNPQLPRGGRVSYCLSPDEGRTWSAAQVLYDGPDDDRDPSIMQTTSGRLLCSFFSLRKAEGKNPPWTGLGSWMVYSDDLGTTWSEPRQIAADYYCSSPIRQLSDGRLALGLYKETAGLSHGAVVFSSDNGLTWDTPVDIDNNGMPLDAETDLIELKDGTLHAAQRSAGDSMAWSESKDGGKSWSVSAPYGFPGHCPYLHRTANGVLLLAHRLPNTSVHYSLDEGKTWSGNVLVDDHIGAYPSMVNLKDGSVLIVYYEEGELSNIRAKRFLADAQGVHFIPPPQDGP